MTDSDRASIAASCQPPALPLSLSVLVPVLNEERNLAPTVHTLLEALSETVGLYEIIVVNDGSTDRTGEVAEQLAATHHCVKVVHEGRTRGIGHAYMQGYKEATCNYFVYIPGDNTWPVASCRTLFLQLGRAHIVTSYASNPSVRSLGRRILSTVYTRFLNMIFGRKMRYYNGLNIYPVNFLRSQQGISFGFGFQAEVLLKALAAKLSYVEIGLEIDERAAGGSKAISVRNLTSVITTIIRLFFELRFRDHS